MASIKCTQEFYNKLRSQEVKEKGFLGKWYHGHFHLNPNAKIVTEQPKIQQSIQPTVEQKGADPLPTLEELEIEEPKSKFKKKFKHGN